MMALAYFILAAALCVLALRQHYDLSTTALTASLAASIVVSWVGVWSVVPFAATIDALICLVMLAVWSRTYSMRVWAISGLGFLKTCAGAIQYFSDPYYYGWAYYYTINIGFVVQILIAGGYFDAVGYRLDRVLARVAPKRHRILRYGEE